MKAELLAIVEKATVELVQRGGQGVLVPGNLILTAAHCVEWTSTGAMVLGEHYRESIKTWDGRTLRVRPVAVEPVGDIAVLASLDDQECFDEALAFEQFCEEVRPAPICTLDFELFKPFPIKIRTHCQTWIDGEAKQCRPTARNLFIDAHTPIESGTSGSPVLGEHGLVAIVSNAGGVVGTRESVGSAPRPHLALPAWAVREIHEAARCLGARS